MLGEYYGSATETKIARDVPQLIRWMQGGEEPRTVWDTYFQIDRLDSLRMRLSAAYKGLHALLMREGCRDFISGKPVDLMTVYSDPLDIHHIFPRKWCDDRGIDPNLYNSIVNKTALSAGSNREIGGNAPSEYLARIERKYRFEPDQLDMILRTHLIDPDALRADDFEAFYASRKQALANLAQAAQGKAVITEQEVEQSLPDPEMREADKLVFETMKLWPGEFILAEGTVRQKSLTQAEDEEATEAGPTRRAAIFVGPEYGTVSRPALTAAAREAMDDPLRKGGPQPRPNTS